jgi:hypothetical protein
MEKEKQLLLLCCQLIERSLNWGDNSIWSNDDFEQLSKLIFEKTKVRLSISTLKRIWGKVRYDNFPTTATLNALAHFLDYESWRDFRQQRQVNNAIEQNELPDTAPQIPETAATSKNRYNYLWFIPITLLLFAAFYFAGFNKKESPDLSTVKFSSKKTSDDLPNSVVFNYDASAFHSDSVYIQQSWDPGRRELVPGDGKQHTSIYYTPGHFIAKLVVNNRIVKESIVFIKTKGWVGILDHRPVPVYLSPAEIKGGGYMGIKDSLMQQKLGTPVFNNTWLKFSNVREFPGIRADDFTMECTLRNTATPGQSVCRKADLTILGDGMAIIIPIANKGCIADIGVLTGEDWIGGNNHDLSAFGCDFTQYQTLKCVVNNHRLKIYLNNKQIMDVEQKHSIGRIVGLRFEFEGPGQVKHYKLETPGSKVYEENF